MSNIHGMTYGYPQDKSELFLTHELTRSVCNEKFRIFGGPETVRMDAVGHDVIITGNKRCV